MSNPGERLQRVDQHDDGVNRWRMTRLAPPPELAGAIHGYCDYAEHTRTFTTRRELPHTRGVLIFNLGEEVSITGGDGRAIRLRAGEGFVAGVHLRPALSASSGCQAGLEIDLPLLTLRRLLGIPMDQLRDQVLLLEDRLGRVCGERLGNAASLQERMSILDQALANRLRATAAIDRRLTAALAMLTQRTELDITGVAHQVGWSRKHLAAQTQNTLGVGPRSWRRLHRFKRLVATLRRPPESWADIAADAGYCDQSHMIREFREFAGLAPSEYLRRLDGNGGGVIES